MPRLAPALFAACLLAIGAQSASAQSFGRPFEDRLIRISEILGSLHFLRNLCGEAGDDWRVRMEDLLAAEQPDPARRARFVASFNHGYRTFETTYTSCTPSAIAAIRLYMKEGEELARDTALRFGS